MTLRELSIFGSFLATHRVFPDERGLFREWFKAEQMELIDKSFVVRQANYSNSKRYVIRGIHYSLAPEGQAKLVTCANGQIIDVLVDLRVGSPTFLKVEHIELSGDSGNVVFIPSGVGHGFFVRSESASVVYLTSSEYNPTYEKAICPLDLDIGINWPWTQGDPIISRSDMESPGFNQALAAGHLPQFQAAKS